MSIFVKFWLFMMPAHQIWSCHMTQDTNFEKNLFCPNSTFNIRKSYKISSGKAVYDRSYQQKNLTGTPPPPSAFRVNPSFTPLPSLSAPYLLPRRSARHHCHLKNHCAHEYEIFSGIKYIFECPRNVKVAYIVINWLP